MHNPIPAQIPVTIIGGYLGAGKTTLVNHVLRHAQGRKLAVLVNEFGELPIDEDLIEAQGDDLISIAGGCICCSFGSDLTAALIGLLDLPSRPDHVLIECSGVALPSPIAASLSLLGGFSHDGTVVLLDVETALEQIEDAYIGDTLQRQIDDADLVLLNKSDLADPAPVKARLSGKHAIAITRGKIDITSLLGLDPNAPLHVPAGHADALFDSVVLPCTEHMDAQHLQRNLTALGLTRAKGHFEQTDGQRVTLHLVGARTEIAPAPTQAPLGIVCIGLKGQFDAAACHNAAKDAARHDQSAL